MAYQVVLTKAALKQLGKLGKEKSRLFRPVIEGLARNPRPAGARKLAELSDTYRIRLGDYRIVYTIENQHLIVTIIKVAHRREVYR